MIESSQFNPLLLKILKNNRDTEYGRRYHFDYIRTVDGYRFKTPLVNYKDVKPLIDITTRIGENSIYTSDKLVSYAITSGSSDYNHYVPCTEKHISDYKTAFKESLSKTGANVVLFESIPKTIIYSDQAKLNTITGAVLDSMRGELKYYNISSPECLMFREDPSDTVYYHTLFALSSKNVEHIIAPFSWNVIAMVECILSHGESLVSDLRSGTIHFNDRTTDALKQELAKKFTKNEERAFEVETILKTDYTGLLKKLWPNLKMVIAAGTGKFEIYRDRLMKYLGDVCYSNGFFASSEALIGVAIDNTEYYKLYIDNAYIEFLPLNSRDKKTVLFDEVEVGTNYILYITNQAGLYRYCTDDVVQVTSIIDGMPVFKYFSKSNDIISEKLLYKGIKTLSNLYNVDIEDFCYEKYGDGLKLYLEMKEIKAFYGRENEVSKCFDPSLKVRSIGFLRSGAQLTYKRMRAIGGNMAENQLKPIRLIKTKDQEDFVHLFKF